MKKKIVLHQKVVPKIYVLSKKSPHSLNLTINLRPMSGNVPAPLPFRLIPTAPDTPFPDPNMRRQTAHRKLSERQYPSTAGNCNSSHVSIPLTSSIILLYKLAAFTRIDSVFFSQVNPCKGKHPVTMSLAEC